MTITLSLVYKEMKCDTRKGDFHNLMINHLKDLDINMTKTDIRSHKKKHGNYLLQRQWENMYSHKTLS